MKTECKFIIMDSMKKVRRILCQIARRAAVITAYVGLFAFAYWLSFAVRFDFDLDNKVMQGCYDSLALVIAVKLAVFFFHRHFHGYGLYATFRDFQALIKSSIVSSVVIFVLAHYFLELRLPRTIPVLDCVFTIVCIGTVRFAWRAMRQEILPRLFGKQHRKALLIGTNEQEVLLAHEFYDHPELDCRVVGFAALQRKRVGRYISQLPVLGHIDDLDTILTTYEIHDVLSLQGVLGGEQLRAVMAICQKRRTRLRIVPSMEMRLGGATIPMRDIDIEDLLRRQPVTLDDSIIADMLVGKTIMVTGAGGSIGSEICRQVIRFNPETLVILGRGENRIFFLEKEIQQLGYKGSLVSVIADVTNESRMRQVFQQYRPDVVFHAAAHKHVPLMEANSVEAIRNNIFGTKIVADLSDHFCTSTFVLISTDKVVNPTSVMGASKHLAERYVHALAAQSKTKFVVTRFGNVLGSAGSVVPIFRQQIASGGPITVTDFRMTRYFMMIPEASQLVLQAAAMGQGGEIFVLDMGEPVRVVDLAKDMIRLSGLPESAIEICEVGLRPGEKLYEELYFEAEKAIATSHPKLRCASHRQFEWNLVNEQINELMSVLKEPSTIQTKLSELIAEYHPQAVTVPFMQKQKTELSVFPANTERLRKTG